MALKRRRITATSLAAKNSRGGFFSGGSVSRDYGKKRGWGYFIVVAVFGLIYLLLTTTVKTSTKSERLATITKNTQSMYKGLFTPEPIKYRVFDIPLVIRATYKDSLYWQKDFRKFVSDAEAETRRLLDVEALINQSAKKGTTVDLKEYPVVKSIIESGLYFQKTSFNIAAGAVFNDWLNENGEFKVNETENSDGTKTKSYIIPDESKTLYRAGFADPKLITLSPEGILEIKSKEIEIDLTPFREAIFLYLLKEKIPKEMDYLIYFGNRHGVWKLPKEYIRWTVSIDNPFSILNIQRGALKMSDEAGTFAITRRNEKFFEAGKIKYELPVNWKTGKTADQNLGALVIDKDIFRAKMLSYALFISKESDLPMLEKEFNSTDFIVLKNNNEVFVPEKSKPIYLSKEEIDKSKIDNEKRKTDRLKQLLDTKQK